MRYLLIALVLVVGCSRPRPAMVNVEAPKTDTPMFCFSGIIKHEWRIKQVDGSRIKKIIMHYSEVCFDDLDLCKVAHKESRVHGDLFGVKNLSPACYVR